MVTEACSHGYLRDVVGVSVGVRVGVGGFRLKLGHVLSYSLLLVVANQHQLLYVESGEHL